MPSIPLSVPSQTAPSSNFKSMLDAGLAEYKTKTGDDLLAHWLATELKSCESVDGVLDILRDQAKAFEPSGDQKLMKCIDPLVHVLHTFSDALGDGIGLAFPPAKVIFTGIGALLAAAKDARASQGAVIDLFERIESFFKRLEVYTQISLTTKMAEVLVKIVIELLSILSIATKEVKRRLAKIFFRKLLGRTDIEDALKRLESLIQEEVQMAIAQILKATTEVKDGADKTNMAMQQMSDEIGEVKHDVGEVKHDIVEMKWTQIEQDIHKWFSPPDPCINYNIACKAQYEGTTTWFFEGAKLKDWMSIGSLLWIHGKPGSGKSILCSAIIKHIISLRDAGQASLAFFYFDFRDEEKKQDFRNFVTSLLVQLSAYSTPCCKIISRIYSKHGKGAQQPSNDTLTNCLREMLSRSTRQPIYLIVDALDECPDSSGIPTPREDVLKLLEDLVRLRLSNLRICATSRPEYDIKNAITPLASGVVSLHDEIGQMRDISDYVKNVVYSDKKMRSWRSDQKELVVEELSKKADGMFRWVFCQLEVLRHCLPASIRQTLDQLPESLDETYVRVLSQIPQANQTHAHRMLQCLTVAVRPLRVDELAELLAFEFDGAQGGIPKYRAAWRLDDQTQAVLSTCSSLVTIVNHFVQFSHFSVKEFLMSNRLGDFSRYRIRPTSAHIILTQTCLGSLLHLDNHIGIKDLRGDSLAEYAALHWVEHAQFDNVASRVKDGMETLFDPDKPHFAAWLRIHDINGIYGRRFSDMEISTKPKPNPLYYSVLCGFYDLVKHLAIKHPQYVNAICGRYSFPLLAALCEDHVEVAELLLEHGANVNVRDATGGTMLLRVLSRLKLNLVNTVGFLLKHGADVNARDDALMTPLHLAEYRGELEVAQMLLKHNAAVNCQNMNGKTPLHILLEYQMYDEGDVLDHVLLLFEHGAEVNRQDNNNGTPLYLAAGRSWFNIVWILLGHGADANAANINGKTPLHILLERWRYSEGAVLDHVLLFLEHGGEVNRRDKDDQTALHSALRRGWFKLVRILLKHGADASMVIINGKTPLHILLERLHSEDTFLNHAQLLLEHGAEVSGRDKDNQTPLNLAMGRSWFKLVQFLLEHGADANAENKGKSPLHVLSEPWMDSEDDALNYARLLLKHGAEVDARDKDYQTPLFPAMVRGWFKVARILLEHGSDANAANKNGKTPLHLLSESQARDGDILDHAQLLFEHGAEANSLDEDNQTPLHLAAGRNSLKLARSLLEHGADANAANNSGKTTLHILSERQTHDSDALDLIWLLLNHGAVVNKRDKNNQTALHLAVRKDWFKLAWILLQRGADVNAENNNGETPLDMLLERQIYDTTDFGDTLNHTRLWSEHGAEVNRRYKGNETSLLLEIDASAENNTDETSVQRVSRGQYGTLERGVDAAPPLLERGAVTNAQDEIHLTWSHFQSNFGPVQMAQALLDHGADVNSGNNGGVYQTSLSQELEGLHVQYKNRQTPLHLASFHGKLDLVRVLLGHGANVNSEDNFGRTPLHLVAEGKFNFEQDRLLITQLLLERDADANAQGGGNATPLHLASYGGRVAIAHLLLDRGASVNSKGHRSRTPLHSVAEGRCLYSEDDGISVAQLLLDHGADVNAPDEDNKTPLHLASYSGSVEIARVLLDAGATANSKGNQGRTALHAIAEGRDYYFRENDGRIAQLLLERGADVNVSDDDNQTPLHLASSFGKVELALVLLNAGANANAKDAQGQTPLHLVSQCPNRGPDDYEGDCVGITQILLDHGADANAQDNNHATPSDLASYHGRADITSLLLQYGGKTNTKMEHQPTPRQPEFADVQFHDENRPPSTSSLGHTWSPTSDPSASMDSLAVFQNYDEDALEDLW